DVAGQGQFAGLRLDVGADVVVGAVAGLGPLLDRLLDRLDDDLLLDRLLARDRVGDLEQFKPVGADAGKAHRASSSSGGFDSRAARASAPRFNRLSVSTSLASASQANGIRAVSSSRSR